MAAFQYVLAYVFFALWSHKLQANGSFPVEFNFLDALPRTENSIKSNRNCQELHPLYDQGAKNHLNRKCVKNFYVIATLNN